LRFTALEPKSADGAALLARAYFGVKEYPEAAKASAVALQLDPNNADVIRVRARSLAETKDFQGALAQFDNLSRHGGLKPEDQADYGNALVGAGKEDEALKALLAAVQADSTNCEPYFNLGFLYMKKQDYDQAAVMFEKRIACDPRSLSSYVNAAACYMQRKIFPRAGELLRKALELKPDFLQGRLWLARYFTYVDSLERAKEEYDKVLSDIGTNTAKYQKEAQEAQSMTGTVYFTQRRWAKAVESFRAAAALGYNNAGMELSWGQALLLMLDPKGDPADNQAKKEEAVKHFKKSVDMEQRNPTGHVWLAQALIQSRIEGDDKRNRELTEEACGEYRKALKLDPRNEDAKKGITLYGCK
jgi:tetratricopeptide (TPR) repeat protein